MTGKEAIRIPGLNEFELVQVIGVGGFGAVSQVKWCGYDAVLKTGHKIILDEEAKILRKVHHPHVVPFFCQLETVSENEKEDEEEEFWPPYQRGSKYQFLMERMTSDLRYHMAAVVGEKPSQLLNTFGPERKHEQPPFSNPVAIDIMLQVAKAVWHMHSKNVVHRDLKPANILVRPVCEDEVPELFALGFLQVKVGGFGVARDNIMRATKEPLTPKVGTSRYMSPEVFNQESSEGENYPHKTDSWSFGIMCSDILSGERPFPGMMMRDLEAALDSGVRPWIPEACPDYVKFCLESCWKYNPKERPRFSDIWRMLRFAKLRSLGLIHQNSDLFGYRDDEGHVVELSTPPTTETIPAGTQRTITRTN